MKPASGGLLEGGLSMPAGPRRSGVVETGITWCIGGSLVRRPLISTGCHGVPPKAMAFCVSRRYALVEMDVFLVAVLPQRNYGKHEVSRAFPSLTVQPPLVAFDLKAIYLSKLHLCADLRHGPLYMKPHMVSHSSPDHNNKPPIQYHLYFAQPLPSSLAPILLSPARTTVCDWCPQS